MKKALLVFFSVILLIFVCACFSEEKIENLLLEDKIICIDAGHGKNSSNDKEPIAPGSSEKKAAFVSGTQGGGMTEEELNLIIAIKLEEKLKELGAEVYMTRISHETQLSNVGRAELANKKCADLCVKIHADGSENPIVKGMTMLVPSEKYVGEEVAEKSRVAGEKILAAMIEKTGAENRGIRKRSDMTGFNWSKVPVVLLEVGFMTNKEECELLKSEEYQGKIVDGIALGITNYFQSEEVSYE